VIQGVRGSTNAARMQGVTDRVSTAESFAERLEPMVHTTAEIGVPPLGDPCEP
jgi:hypothetical protein